MAVQGKLSTVCVGAVIDRDWNAHLLSQLNS